MSDTNKYDIIELSRSKTPELAALGVKIRQLDYGNQQIHRPCFKRHAHLLSTIGTIDQAGLKDAQLLLLSAAREAGVKCFAPSEYSFSTYDSWDMYAGKTPVWQECLKSGLFMNTLGIGTPKGEEEALGGLRPWTFVINMKAGTADLPGNGNAAFTLTRTADIGRFVAAALELGKREEEIGMVGENTTYNELVGKIERATNRKMLVRYNSEEELERMAKESERGRFYNQVRFSLAKGEGVVPSTLNELCPEVKPWSVEQYLERYWRGVELGQSAWQKSNILK